MLVHVLLYNVGKDDEGIHSIDIKGKTIVLMFEDIDDADRYCGLLEAQDFPKPSVELIERKEIDVFCLDAGYEPRLVEKGFLPKTEEDRLLITPPQLNLDVQTSENEEHSVIEEYDSEKINLFRKSLEDLI